MKHYIPLFFTIVVTPVALYALAIALLPTTCDISAPNCAEGEICRPLGATHGEVLDFLNINACVADKLLPP